MVDHAKIYIHKLIEDCRNNSVLISKDFLLEAFVSIEDAKEYFMNKNCKLEKTSEEHIFRIASQL